MTRTLASFFIFLLLIQTKNSVFADYRTIEADEITYEWLIDLGNTTGYTDHIPVFREIFSQMNVRTFLEFGVGYSTKYFIDNCAKVISVEFVTDGSGPDWIKVCLGLYRNCTNWMPLIYFSDYRGADITWAPHRYLGSQHLYVAASYQCGTHKNYALIDDFYLVELNKFILNLKKQNKIDVAFVDPGIYLRGDLVQLLFDKVPVILAHDTRCRFLGHKDDVYGYSRIATPENYEEIFIPTGQGVTAWILKDEKFNGLIQKLKAF